MSLSIYLVTYVTLGCKGEINLGKCRDRCAGMTCFSICYDSYSLIQKLRYLLQFREYWKMIIKALKSRCLGSFCPLFHHFLSVIHSGIVVGISPMCLGFPGSINLCFVSSCGYLWSTFTIKKLISWLAVATLNCWWKDKIWNVIRTYPSLTKWQ